MIFTERKKPDFAQQCMPKDDPNHFEGNSGWIRGTESFTARVVKHSNVWPRGATNQHAGAAQSSAGQAVEASPALNRGMNKGLPEVPSNWNYSLIL